MRDCPVPVLGRAATVATNSESTDLLDNRPFTVRALLTQARDAPALRSFHYRDFRLLWSGQLVMSIGMWLQQIGVLWFALTLTGSPIVVSLAFGMYFFPSFILGPFSGTIADRIDRKKLLMTVQILDLVASLLLAVVVITEVAQVWSLLLILMLSGIARSFMMPTLQPLIFEIVGPRDVQNGISLLMVAFRNRRGLGAVAAGILIEVFGTGGAFVAATISYALGLLVISFISYQRVGEQVNDTSVVANLVEGLRLFSGSTVLITLLACRWHTRPLDCTACTAACVRR